MGEFSTFAVRFCGFPTMRPENPQKDNEEFYASHPNGQKIRVKVEIMGMYEQTMPTILASSDEDKPEIIMMPDGNFNSWMAQYASQFENLDPYIAESGFDETELWDGAVSRYKYKYENNAHVFGEGSVYALPKDVSPNVMFYNKDFLFVFPVIHILPELKKLFWAFYYHLNLLYKPNSLNEALLYLS